MALVSYVFERDFGANKEGEVVSLEPDQAQALVDGGILAEATEEDVSPSAEVTDDMESPEAPEVEAAVTRAVKREFTSHEKRLVGETRKALSKAPNLTVPAQTKEPAIKSMSHLFQQMISAKSGNRTAQNRLAAYQAEMRQKSPAGANEGTNTQGGYFIKPEWYKTIWDHVRKYPDLIGMTDRYPISGNQFNINEINETGAADGSRHGGVLGYWITEAATVTGSYPAMTQQTLNLGTNVVLVPVTNQLLEDANIEAFDTKIKQLAGEELRWQENQAIINGSGTNQPQGILNAPSLVTVTKSTNDSSAMFGLRDCANMYRAMYSASRNSAVWLVNPEAFTALALMVFEPATGSATTYPALGGVSYNASDVDGFPLRLFGRPVIEVLNCAQLGSVGDIIFADLSQLVTAEHPQVYVDVSDQFYFTTLQTLFRFYRRYDIRTPWKSTYASVDGNYLYSPFVALSSRGT